MVIFVCLAMCYTYVDDDINKDSNSSTNQFRRINMSDDMPRMQPFNVSSTLIVPMVPENSVARSAHSTGKRTKNALPFKKKFFREKNNAQ